MLHAAKNKVRVKISYVMMALTVAGCILMVIEGKKVRVDFLSLSVFHKRQSGIDPRIYPLRRGGYFPTQEITRHKVRYSRDKPRISRLGINSKS